MTSAVPKPENALKRAEELFSAGQQEEALNVLHATISNRKLKILGWDPNTELVMLCYVKRCVELNKLKLVREGLHFYRYLTQQHNVVSLARVMKELRDLSEAKLEAIKSQADAEALARGVDDLEAIESPETLLLASLQIEVRDETAQALNKALSGCWEAYKIIMDLLRYAPKLEHVYHDTAYRASQFCRTYQRPQEFKRLCDTLRTQYINCLKNRGKPDFEVFARPDSHLSTRIIQMQVAADLNLWTQCFQIAEDILQLGLYEIVQKALVSKDANAQKTRSILLQHTFIFYEKLAQMFFVSKQMLFHASAILKNIFHTRQHKKNLTPEEAEKMCDVGVVAVLCVPIYTKQNQSALELEHQKRLACMLAHNTIPTRESMQYIIETRNIVSLSAPLIQKLYSLIENDIDVLTICESCNELLNQLKELPYLAPYVIHLKHVILQKLLLRLSSIYLTIDLNILTTKILPESFLLWKEAETLIANYAEGGYVKIRFDYSKNVLIFADESTSPDNMLHNRLVSLATTLTDLVPKMVIPNKPAYESFAKIAKQAVYKDFPRKLEEEVIRLSERNRIVSERRRKQEEEQQAKERAKRTEEKEKQKKEELEEQTRREVALKQQEALRIKEAQQQMRVNISKQILADFKTLADRSATKLLIQGRPVEEITYEQIASGEITYEDYEKAQEEVSNKERQEKHRQQRQETKRVEHLIRAIREEEATLYAGWAAQQEEKDEKEYLEYVDYLKKVEQYHHELAIAQHVSIIKRKEHLLPYYTSIKKSHLERYENARTEWLKEVAQFIVEEKCNRAAFLKAKADEEKLEQERIEKQKQLEEEKNKRDRAAAIQKRKNEEIDRKLEEDRKIFREIHEKTDSFSYGQHDSILRKQESRGFKTKPPTTEAKLIRKKPAEKAVTPPEPAPATSTATSVGNKYVIPAQRVANQQKPKADLITISRKSKPSEPSATIQSTTFTQTSEQKKKDVFSKPQDVSFRRDNWMKKDTSNVESAKSSSVFSSQQDSTKSLKKSSQKDSDGYTYVGRNKRKQ